MVAEELFPYAEMQLHKGHKLWAVYAMNVENKGDQVTAVT